LLTTIGTGCFLSALNVKYRDFRFVIPFLVQFSLYASPIIYNIDSIKNQTIKFILSANPITVAINIYRSAFDPTASIDYTLIGFGLSISLALLSVGIYYFRKTESYFADLA
jgi:lipopolysaccharide transport system permease protein